MAAKSRRLMKFRWRPLTATEADRRAWMQAQRAPLRRAMYRVRLDYLLALHWLRYLLIRYIV